MAAIRQQRMMAMSVAEVVIYNDQEDVVAFADGDVSLDGLTVHLTFQRDVSPGAPDTFAAYPPAGLIAVPQSVTLMDGYSGSILICDAAGVGA